MYFNRAYDLIYNKNYREIIIFGLGSCLNSAIILSLTIMDGIPNLKIASIETNTINMIDDFIDEDNNNVIFFLYKNILRF